nr:MULTISPECIES: dihydroorotate dehydrogenase [Aneurinibacillus]
MYMGGNCMGFFGGEREIGVILVLFILLVIIACACD